LGGKHLSLAEVVGRQALDFKRSAGWAVGKVGYNHLGGKKNPLNSEMNTQPKLACGFKHFLFSTLRGEMIQFA